MITRAILDRIIHHSYLFNITGNSYRLKDKIIQDDINDKSGEFYFDIYNRFSFFIQKRNYLSLQIKFKNKNILLNKVVLVENPRTK